MKIIIACDKYKGSLSSIAVCNTIAKAIESIDNTINVVVNPMADGGEGTVDTLVESLKGRFEETEVAGPLGEKINARFGIINNNIAVIEMAAASGLYLVPFEKRNPMDTTTFGTGQLIRKALDLGCRKIITGIGGSATNDGGMGMAQALGVRFFDEDDSLLGMGGRQLNSIKRIDISEIDTRIDNTLFECACDVENPLTGKNGAAYVYGAQKGADHETIKVLNRGLINFSKIINNDLKKNIRDIKGAGAAGGLGGGMVAFLKAKLRIGANIVIDVTKLEEKIKGADLVITGEGAFDKQTFYGKTAYGVATLAKRYKIPVITINGSVLYERKNIEKADQNLFLGNFSILNKPMDLSDAVENAEGLLESASREILNFYIKILRNKNYL